MVGRDHEELVASLAGAFSLKKRTQASSEAAFDAPQDGLVGPEVLGKIVPGDFIDIKKKAMPWLWWLDVWPGG